jgi:cysteine desulfurase
MQSLAMIRVSQMAKSTDTELTEKHLKVLEFAWAYYRKRRVGPLYNNIKRYTGVAKADLETMFPNGLISLYTWVGIPVQSAAGGCKPMVLVETENPREVYFDNNATTPIRREVADALIGFFEDPQSFGNPSSSYTIGSIAYDTIDLARKRIADCLGVNPEEIYFTGSGTEANNIAIKGVAERHGGGHIISTNVEHPAVQETLRYLETKGFAVTYLPVERDGTINAELVDDAMRPDTILVCIMVANNEIGTIYPFEEIGAVCRRHGVQYFADAIQAFGKIPIAPKAAGIDILSLSGHKIYAPKGIGALYVGNDAKINPMIHGGGQESGLRPGTENVAGIMALGLAAKLAHAEIGDVTERMLQLRRYFMERLKLVAPDAIINGTLTNRLSNNLSVGFPGVDSGSLLLSFNQIGISVSAGSACSAGEDKASHVLDAIQLDSNRYGTIRFSFNRTTAVEDIDYLFEYLPEILSHLAESEPALREAS